MGYLHADVVRWLATYQRSVSEGRAEEHVGTTYLEQQTFIRCGACRTAMRLPQLESRIVISCPHCGLRTLVQVAIRPAPGFHQRLIGWLRKALRVLFGTSSPAA